MEKQGYLVVGFDNGFVSFDNIPGGNLSNTVSLNIDLNAAVAVNFGEGLLELVQEVLIDNAGGNSCWHMSLG